MPDSILIIVTVQTVPGLKLLVHLAHHWHGADGGKSADQQYIPEDSHQLFSPSVWRLLVHRPGAESRTSRGLPRKENLLHLDVLGSASGGHGQAEVRMIPRILGETRSDRRNSPVARNPRMAVCKHLYLRLNHPNFAQLYASDPTTS